MELLNQENQIGGSCTHKIKFNPYDVGQTVRFSQISPFIMNEFDLIIVGSFQQKFQVYKSLNAKQRVHFHDDWGRLPVIAIHKNTLERDDSESLEIYVLDIAMDDFLD